MKFLFLIFLSLACFEKDYTPDDIFKLLRVGDKTVVAVPPKDLNDHLVRCDDYKPKCNNAFIIKIKGLDVKFLQYSAHKDAYDAALYVGGYVIRNWAIEDVSGEPILERFVMKYLGARKAF